MEIAILNRPPGVVRSHGRCRRPFGVNLRPRFVAAFEGVKGDPRLYPSATAEDGANLKMTADRFQSFSHADETKALGPLDFNIESCAIVDDA